MLEKQKVFLDDGAIDKFMLRLLKERIFRQHDFFSGPSSKSINFAYFQSRQEYIVPNNISVGYEGVA